MYKHGNIDLSNGNFTQTYDCVISECKNYKCIFFASQSHKIETKSKNQIFNLQ